MLRSASLVPTSYGRAGETPVISRMTRGRVCGSVSLAVIYGIAVYASVGLFQTSVVSPHRAAYTLLGLVNVAALPIFMVGAAAGICRIWLDGTPNPRIAQLVLAPLWASFILALLTVPLWMGMANMEQQGSAPAAWHYSPTFLLAPWGFMLAYGLALLIICVMFDFTFPVRAEAKPQVGTAGQA